MSIRLSRLATVALAGAVIVVMSSRSWAIYDQLPPSRTSGEHARDVALNVKRMRKLTVVFITADASEGRLKPFYSATVVAFSKPDSQGGRSYDVKAPIELKSTEDGQRVGQVKIGKEFADRAMIRILTLTVDGKRRSSAAYAILRLAFYLNKGLAAGSYPVCRRQSSQILEMK